MFSKHILQVFTASLMLCTRISHCFLHGKVFDSGLPREFLGFPTFQYGDWPFITCNQDQGAKLVKLWRALGDLIDNKMVPDLLNNGPKSRNGYTSMFGKNSPRDVATVLQDISAHRAFSTLNRTKRQPDLFIHCVNPLPDPHPSRTFIKDWAIKSTKVAQEACDTGYHTFTTPGRDIFVCPKVFEHHWLLDDVAPLAALTCPTVNRFGTTFASPRQIAKHNSFTFLYQLSRKYAPQYLFPKLWTIRECFEATKEQQLSNGNNYAFYGSCESPFIPLLLVTQLSSTKTYYTVCALILITCVLEYSCQCRLQRLPNSST